jgi:hypothetical protein
MVGLDKPSFRRSFEGNRVNEIKRHFDSLDFISHFFEFNTKRIAGRSHWLAGRNAQGRAVFIIEGAAKPSRPMQVGALTVEIGLDLVARIDNADVPLKGCLILSLSRIDNNLELYFSEICWALAHQLLEARDQEALMDNLSTLVKLFGPKSVSRDSLKGFWGELAFATWFESADRIVAAWPGRPDARMDFQSSAAKWDIKTVEASERTHHFGLHQLSSENDWIISIVIEESPIGKSIHDLVANLSQRLSAENAFSLKLRSAAFLLSPESKTLKFEIQRESLQPRLFSVRGLPRPIIPADANDFVLSVNFVMRIPEKHEYINLLRADEDVIRDDAHQVLLGS